MVVLTAAGLKEAGVDPDHLSFAQHAFIALRRLAPPPAIVPAVNVVTGKVLKDKRAAVVVHDGEMVFLLKGGTKKPEPPWLPQLRIEVGSSAIETAVRALNSYVGVAAFRGSGERGRADFAGLFGAKTVMLGATARAEVAAPAEAWRRYAEQAWTHNSSANTMTIRSTRRTACEDHARRPGEGDRRR